MVLTSQLVLKLGTYPPYGGLSSIKRPSARSAVSSTSSSSFLCHVHFSESLSWLLAGLSPIHQEQLLAGQSTLTQTGHGKTIAGMFNYMHAE